MNGTCMNLLFQFEFPYLMEVHGFVAGKSGPRTSKFYVEYKEEETADWTTILNKHDSTPRVDIEQLPSKQGTSWQHCSNVAIWYSPNGNIVTMLPLGALFVGYFH